MKKSINNKEIEKRIKITIVSRNPMKYNLVPIGKYRSFFPGYKIPFTLNSDIGDILVHVSSAKTRGTKKGTANAGRYIKSLRVGRKSGLLNEWFKKHDDLKIGDKIVIDIKKQKYKLNIEKSR